MVKVDYKYTASNCGVNAACALQVMLAMGFLGPEAGIIEQLELAQDPRSNIETPKGHYTTSIPKVFAAGGELAHTGI
jgi:NADPH-dependent glutamate synthase beta subunit-like oxidoreductase